MRHFHKPMPLQASSGCPPYIRLFYEAVWGLEAKKASPVTAGTAGEQDLVNVARNARVQDERHQQLLHVTLRNVQLPDLAKPRIKDGIIWQRISCQQELSELDFETSAVMKRLGKMNI